MGTFEDLFMLPSGVSIQDAHDGISHWKKIIPVGTKYSISVKGTTVKLKASLPCTMDEYRQTERGKIYRGMMGSALLGRIESQLIGVEMTMEFIFTEMTDGIQVYAFLEGAINRGMGDYESLKTHLLTGSGIPDRDFDRYLTEQTKKPEKDGID